MDAESTRNGILKIVLFGIEGRNLGVDRRTNHTCLPIFAFFFGYNSGTNFDFISNLKNSLKDTASSNATL